MSLFMDSLFKTVTEIDETEIASSTICDLNDLPITMGKVGNTDFIIISQNIRGIHCNFNDFCLTLSQLNFSVDLIVLTECRLDSKKPIPQLNNFVTFQTTKHLNQCDGVVIYVNQKHKTNVFEVILMDASCLQITLNEFTVLGIYRSPSNLNGERFIISLDNHLKSLKTQQSIVLTGDININLIPDDKAQTNERKNRTNYLNMLTTHGLLPGHVLPTRNKNCLDHFILKIDKNKNSASINILNTSITDHSTILLKLTNIIREKKTPNISTKIDYEKAVESFQKVSFHKMLFCSNPDALTDQLIGELRQCILKNTSTNKISRKNRILKPWITQGILRCIRNRNNMQKKLKSDPTNEILKITYRRYRNHCNALIKKLKQNYDREQLSKNKKNSRLLWKSIDKITHRKENKSGNLELLNSKQTAKTSVDHVNTYFANIGRSLAENILRRRHAQNKFTENRTDLKHATSMVLLDSDSSEVYRIIMGLRSESAAGWDGISTKFLKLVGKEVSPVISHLANLCMAQGIFPTALKKAVITPIHKGGHKDEACNYRPISVLPVLAKIIEKIINIRLINYLTKFKILSEAQYGFRRGVSTEDAVLALTSHITGIVDKNKKCITVFLDLQKAFDTVSLPILIQRLEAVGIRGPPLSLLSDYLRNRKQCVKIGDHFSELQDTTYGVPQGSVLGPTLFLIYINNLCNLGISNGRIFSYADDTAVVFSGSTWDEVYKHAQKDLVQIAYWLDSNLLTLNSDKTKYICFTNYESSQPKSNYKIKIHSCTNYQSQNCSCNEIQKISKIKYLGVMVDQRLTWHAHIDLLITRIRKLSWFFKTLRHIADKDLLKQIYTSLVQSVLTYCIPVWGGTTKTKFLELERAHRSLLKVAYFKPFRYPTASLYNDCGLLSVRKLYILQVTLKLHKNLPLITIHRQKRRPINVAPVTRVKTAYAKRQFTAQSAHIYNKINKVLNFHANTSYKCKHAILNWLQTKHYNEIENLMYINA